MELAESKDYWRAVVNTVINSGCREMRGIYWLPDRLL